MTLSTGIPVAHWKDFRACPKKQEIKSTRNSSKSSVLLLMTLKVQKLHFMIYMGRSSTPDQKAQAIENYLNSIIG